MQKKLLLILVLFKFSFASAQNNSSSQLVAFFESTNQFLSLYVEGGLVNYTLIKENETQLDDLVNQISSMNINKAAEEEQKAFFINAYNLLVMKGIVDEYPVNSPQSISGFFDANKFSIAGEQLTLNQIEKEKLNPKIDPRLHFVLVCGANGCPVIEPFAYRPNQLDAQLDLQTKKALNDRSFTRLIRAGKEVKLSQIFSWYKSDFTAKGVSVIDYVNQYRGSKIPSNFKVSHYEYDWSLNDDIRRVITSNQEGKSNLETFTPSALFNKGQFEVNLFNSIYYQNEVRDREGDELTLGESQSFFNSMLQFTTGITKSARFNIGLDLNFVTARYSNEKATGLNFFNDDEVTFRKTILSSIGPRIKFNPLKSVPRLSVQSTFLIPVAKDQEASVDEDENDAKFIFHDRYTWFTQLFYDQSIGEDFQVFLEADMLYRINRNSTNDKNFFRVPLSGFLSYFPNSKSTLFVFSQYSPRFETVANEVDSQFGLSQWFTQVGFGAKYQLTSKIGIELSYADFALSKNDGAGNNINFGLRYIYR